MIAQVTTALDPLVGGAGWVGAGLFGLVLAWLFLRYLPAKDKQTEEFIDKKDQQLFQLLESQKTLMIELAKQNTQSMVALGGNFENSLRIVVDHCEKEFSRILSIIEQTRRIEKGESE